MASMTRIKINKKDYDVLIRRKNIHNITFLEQLKETIDFILNEKIEDLYTVIKSFRENDIPKNQICVFQVKKSEIEEDLRKIHELYYNLATVFTDLHFKDMLRYFISYYFSQQKY